MNVLTKYIDTQRVTLHIYRESISRGVVATASPGYQTTLHNKCGVIPVACHLYKQRFGETGLKEHSVCKMKRLRTKICNSENVQWQHVLCSPQSPRLLLQERSVKSMLPKPPAFHSASVCQYLRHSKNLYPVEQIRFLSIPFKLWYSVSGGFSFVKYRAYDFGHQVFVGKQTVTC